MATPLVSVIIPSRNAAPRIDACLRSVLAQSHSKLEIIVVDDSTDDTLARAQAVLEKSGRRFRTLRGENEGVSAARNLGLTHATGDYIQWLDADDEIAEPTKIARQVESLSGRGADVVSVTDFAWLDVDLEQPMFRPVPTFLSNDPLLDFLLGRVPQPAAFLFPRTFAERIHARGVFTEGVSFAEDREYATVAALMGAKFVHVPLVGVIYFRWSSDRQLSRAGDAHSHACAFEGVFARLRRQVEDLALDLPAVHRALLAQDWRFYRWSIRESLLEPWAQPRVVTVDGRTIDLTATEAAVVQTRASAPAASTRERLVQGLCETASVFRYDMLAVRRAVDRLVEARALVDEDDAAITKKSSTSDPRA